MEHVVIVGTPCGSCAAREWIEKVAGGAAIGVGSRGSGPLFFVQGSLVLPIRAGLITWLCCRLAPASTRTLRYIGHTAGLAAWRRHGYTLALQICCAFNGGFLSDGQMIQLLKAKSAALARLCEQHRVARLEVFGSAAAGSFDASRSDFDFLVGFEPGLDLGPWLARYFALRNDLEQLLERSVDLVMLSALRNKYLIDEVNRTRELLYAA